MGIIEEQIMKKGAPNEYKTLVMPVSPVIFECLFWLEGTKKDRLFLYVADHSKLCVGILFI